MPWINDENGERKYKVSLYAKEELPTWGEVYDWISKPGQLIYSQRNEDKEELDPYWKVPALKYKLAIVCNQFNKMLFEDGFREQLIEHLNARYSFHGTLTDIRFILESITLECFSIVKNNNKFDGLSDPVAKFMEWDAEYHKCMNEWYHKIHFDDRDTPPAIYTIPLPTGEKNPFITNDFPRTNINDLPEYPLMIMPVMKVIIDSESFGGAFQEYSPDLRLISFFGSMYSHDTKDKMNIMYADIISFMTVKVRDYFENGVGWKDENGHLIENEDQAMMCQGSGSDPAL